MIELLWNNPIGAEQAAEYCDALRLAPGQRVLDVGCGCGEWLIRLAERESIDGLGIDTSSESIAEAERRSQRLGVRSPRFLVADAQRLKVGDRFDAALCIGSTHAFGLGPGALRRCLQHLTSMVVPGGSLLVGEGYLRQPACADYRALLGDFPPDEQSHAFNMATGRELGLEVLNDWTSSPQEWDEFEYGYQAVIERRAALAPEDLTWRDKVTFRQRWLDAYQRWGRETLGFGVYHFRIPG